MNRVRTGRCIVWSVLVAGLGAGPLGAQVKDVAHPFLIWTREEAAAIRKRIETDDLARKQFEIMVQRDGPGGKAGYPPLLNLFKYSVLGDKAAGETEKKALVSFFGRRPPESVRGNPASGNAPYRDDHWIDGVRFDVLYDDLTEAERTAYLDTLENYMQWFRTKNGPWRRCTTNGTPRCGWLPNMQYPTVAGLHVMAVATKDEKIIKEMFEAMGGFKWWLEVYLADSGFYMEEFAKYGSPVGAQILWCEGVERLGLSQYGYGCVAKPVDIPGHAGGATMRGYLESLIRAAYPRVLRGADMPDYPCVNMGDAGSKAVVRGVNADGSGGESWWATSNMWGAHKMMNPFWWEFMHRRFPDGGFDYFLAQMRKPGETVYLPSLYVGLGPIDATKVKPPAAPSVVALERGFALLRADESPAYWESPAPAVGLQFGMYYVHYVHDCFSILQYVADNRFVYDKMGYISGGYAGGDPVRDSVRGQGSGVTVDSRQISPVDSGDHGCRNQRIRQRLAPLAKFVAVRARPAEGPAAGSRYAAALYPDVDAERALVLTAEYLFDVYRLTSDRDRVYDWHAQGRGQLVGAGAEPWQTSTNLADGRFWDPRMTDGRKTPDPQNVRRKEVGDAAWAEVLQQGGEGEKAVGVRIAMLPETGTSLFTFTVPGVKTNEAATLMARRTGPSATFAALHEPFRNGPGGHRVARFDRIAQNEKGLAVAVAGKPGSGIDDRILLRYGDDPGQPLTVDGGGESFTFSDYAFVRIGADQVTADGDIKTMKVRVAGTPTAVLNGKPCAATVQGGLLEMK